MTGATIGCCLCTISMRSRARSGFLSDSRRNMPSRASSSSICWVKSTATPTRTASIGSMAPDQIRDPLGKNVSGRGLGRDGCRTPMQWDSTTHADFSSVEPWLPLGGGLDHDNVLAQRSDHTSMYRLYRGLIDLRRKRPALSLGSYGSVRADGNLLVFTREHGREQLLVALNFGDAPLSASLPSGECVGRLLLSSAADRVGEPVRGSSFSLRANEGAIVEL